MIGVSSDGLVKVISVEYGIEDEVSFQFKNGKIERSIIDYSTDSPSFKVGELVYYFNEIMRVG